jgi:hypothetical protein
MKTAITKAKELLKGLFLTKEGWISWLIANVITSLPWAVPLIYGFIFKDSRSYIIAGSIWTFMMLPITPFWILNVFIAYFFLKFLTKRKTHD